MSGQTAQALVCFNDYRDTFLVNLDSRAVELLGLAPGMYFQVHVPTAGLTLLSVFDRSWEEGRPRKSPTGARGVRLRRALSDAGLG